MAHGEFRAKGMPDGLSALSAFHISAVSPRSRKPLNEQFLRNLRDDSNSDECYDLNQITPLNRARSTSPAVTENCKTINKRCVLIKVQFLTDPISLLATSFLENGTFTLRSQNRLSAAGDHDAQQSHGSESFCAPLGPVFGGRCGAEALGLGLGLSLGPAYRFALPPGLAAKTTRCLVFDQDVNEVINGRKMSVQWVSLDNVCGYSLSGVRIKGREKGGSGQEGGGLLITTSSAINIYGRQLSRLEKLIKYSVPGWIGNSSDDAYFKANVNYRVVISRYFYNDPPHLKKRPLSRLRKTKIDINNVITPPDLFGIDRKIEYASKKYHSRLIWEGVIIGLAIF
ncbi:hypothetical protein WN51_02719 [Melipona quadrifasciata]|uniref:Uncharacterized protein n=1 Tax=Melipona quadrifasciata TaxID=166423 RepID=A0A0N0BJP9_9HYME|nr:hypothetical protein WN51_02719 [Melipona quadrifasciata]